MQVGGTYGSNNKSKKVFKTIVAESNRFPEIKISCISLIDTF